jgi:hypothetical protein
MLKYAGLCKYLMETTLSRLDIGSSRPYDLDRDEWETGLVMIAFANNI